MAATGSVPAVPPLWTGKVSGNYEQSLRAMTIIDGEEVFKA